MADTNTNPYVNIDPVLLAMSEEATPNTTTEQDAPMENQQASQPAQSNMEENSDVDPEILAMLEEAKQAFLEGLEEQAACDRQTELDAARQCQDELDDELDREFEEAFATLDEEDPGWDDPGWDDVYSDRSGANTPSSLHGYGFEFANLPDEYKNFDDDAGSLASDDSLFREKIPPVGQRPILKPKTRVRATPAEKAAAAMLPFTISNPVNVPAMSFPDNPSWSGDPIPSSGQKTLTFMGVETSVPVLSDTTNVELVNNMSTTTNMNQQCSNEKDRALVGLAMLELNTATHKLIAAGVREASMAADIRRLEKDHKSMAEDCKSMKLMVKDLEERLSEKLESNVGARMIAAKELQVCRNALVASQQSCNDTNKENLYLKRQVYESLESRNATNKENEELKRQINESHQSCNSMNNENADLKRQVSEIANATNDLDKERNDIRKQVTELANHAAFVSGELDTRTRERDFVAQKLGEAQSQTEEAIAANNYHREQLAIMESNAAAKEAEVNTLKSSLTKVESDKKVEVETLMTALTKAESEKKVELENLMTALTKAESEKTAEVGMLMTALTKAESEKQDLERKAQEKEDEHLVKPQEPADELTKSEQYWKNKYTTAEEQWRVIQTDCEAFEQDYFEMKAQHKVADTKISQLTDTISELKAVIQHKEAEIFELNQQVGKFNAHLNDLATATQGERAKHYNEVDKLKKKYMVMESEKLYIDTLLNKSNLECNRLNKVVERNTKEIENLGQALSNERHQTATLEEEVEYGRKSSKEALRVARMASYHRAQRTQGLPRNPRDYGKSSSFPTLEEQMAVWKEEDGKSSKFMEDHRRIIRENPLTPYKPKATPAAEVEPLSADEKDSSVSKDSSDVGVGPKEETADVFDDSSVTAVEPSVSSNDTISEPGNDSDTEDEPFRYYDLNYGKSKEPKEEIRYVEQLVYVDKEIIVDKIIKHTVHQARSPIWAFLYVYVDLWTIYAHHYPEHAAFIGGFHPANVANVAGGIFTHYFPNFTTYMGRLENIASILSSGIPSKLKSLTRIDTKSDTATAKPTNVDSEVKPQTKTPTTITAASPQAEDLTKITTSPTTTDPNVTHKLPPLFSNLLTALLQLLALFLLYQSHHILQQRHIWLAGNEITRSAVARFWGREPGSFGASGRGPGDRYLTKRICFWLIQGSGYSVAVPG
ncbi:hypothetical protein VE03_06062 [Pseudogymnoascus sp. 23342-1-I1]|nr:hypothetical protein VE03_06062 [Pseudogymnoascus sp. 23342-1-I1]